MKDLEQPLTADGVPAAPAAATLYEQALAPVTDLDMSSIGSTGLKHMGGLVREELLPQLDGQNGARIYREMSENDPVLAGILQAIDKIIRQCKWTVEAASNSEYDQEAAEFLESCIGDMEVGFTELVSEVLTMLTYGYSVHEIVYKVRAGENEDPAFNSEYSDGRIGWRGLPIRSQDTIMRWDIDDSGTIQGVQQLAPPQFRLVDIPAKKMLLFRTSVHKNNPEGKSVLRGCYRPWYFKSRIEVSEAIGAERDLAGLPIAWVPPELLAPNQTDAGKRAVFNAVKGIVTGVRQDSQAAIIMPLAFDQQGNKLFDFGLVSSGGSRQFDTDKIIQRYDNRMAIVLSADFILMGQSSSSTGSFAMHTDKTKLFLLGLTAYLGIIADTFNKVAIPRLFSYNSFPVSKYPKIVPGSIEGADLGVLGPFLQILSQIGMPLFPNAALEGHLLKIAGLPANQNEAPVGPGAQVEQSPGAAAPTQSDDDSAAIQALVNDSLVQKKKGPAGWSEDDHPRGADGKFGETQSGKTIHGANHEAYRGLNGDTSTKKHMMDQVAAAHKNYSAQDHRDAAAAHGAAGNDEHAFVHGMLSTRSGAGSKSTPAPKRDSAALEPHETQSLAAYQGSQYTQINGGLRNNKGKVTDPKVKKHVENLDAAIAKNVLSEDTVTHRGMSISMEGVVKPGDVFRDHGYASTSATQKIAKDFAGKNGTVLHITHKKGQSALEVNKHLPDARNREEKEVLLPRGASMRVQRIEKKNGQHHIYVERL